MHWCPGRRPRWSAFGVRPVGTYSRTVRSRSPIRVIQFPPADRVAAHRDRYFACQEPGCILGVGLGRFGSRVACVVSFRRRLAVIGIGRDEQRVPEVRPPLLRPLQSSHLHVGHGSNSKWTERISRVVILSFRWHNPPPAMIRVGVIKSRITRQTSTRWIPQSTRCPWPVVFSSRQLSSNDVRLEGCRGSWEPSRTLVPIPVQGLPVSSSEPTSKPLRRTRFSARSSIAARALHDS